MSDGHPRTRSVIERLITARKNAGLTQGQVSKLLGYSSASGLSSIETDYRPTEPTLSTFFKLCYLYDVSPVWALTGHNPEFNEEEFEQLTQFSSAMIENIDNLKQLLKSLNQSPDMPPNAEAESE